MENEIKFIDDLTFREKLNKHSNTAGLAISLVTFCLAYIFATILIKDYKLISLVSSLILVIAASIQFASSLSSILLSNLHFVNLLSKIKFKKKQSEQSGKSEQVA